MVCPHLETLENALLAEDAAVTFRGQAWSRNCREWVYFDVVLDLPAIRGRFAFDACVEDHENTDPRSGLERGLVCAACHDAVMGRVSGAKRFP